jgi:hypothetical protein
VRISALISAVFAMGLFVLFFFGGVSDKFTDIQVTACMIMLGVGLICMALVEK